MLPRLFWLPAEPCSAALRNQATAAAQDYAEATQWYRKAAEQGHAGGQYNLGYMLEHGLGVGKNLEEAVQWYRKAAAKDDAEAKAALNRLRRAP